MEHWCVGGDLNMIDDPADRVGGNHVTVHAAQLALGSLGALMYDSQDF